MATLTPLRAAAAGAAAVAVVALGLAAGYAWGSGRTTSSGTTAGAPVTLPAALAASSASDTAAPVAGITVSGTGTVSGTPDTLRLGMGVSVSGRTVSDALDAANKAANSVLTALRGHGVADKDLQTSGLSIQPRYDDSDSRKITGYEVSESLTAVLREIRTAGATISAAADAGGDATRINSVDLDLSDTGDLVTAARDKAFDAAKKKAQQYARKAGVDLGHVVSISEQIAAPGPVPVPAAMEASRAVPIATGSQEVAVTVTLVFGLG
jgi:uncharacterized protein YggE